VKPRNNFLYRIQQFKVAVDPHVQPVPIRELTQYLNGSQITFFRKMQAFEQQHAFNVLEKLKAEGCDHPELLKAALLHDIGKILYPLKPWERAMIVITRQIAPSLVHYWGQRQPIGLFKAFAVASRHAEWGADLVSKTGASEMLIELVRRHEDDPVPDQDSYLTCLQKADDSS
jgi:hypothetical protein